MLYCSFDPSQLRAEETQSQGVKNLRAYLDMAATNDDPPTAVSGRTTADRHRDDIADALEHRGIAVRRSVGLSDFRIDLVLAETTKPEEPRVAVLLDGPEWRGRGTVRDRDGLPIAMLSQMMRWPRVERGWLPEWIRDREGVLSRLGWQSTLCLSQPTCRSPPRCCRCRQRTQTDDARRATTLAAAPAAIPAATTARLPGEERFSEWVSPYIGSRDVLDQLPSPRSAAQVRGAAETIVAYEGPVHPDRLARLIAASFQLTRLNANRIDSIFRALPDDLRPTDGEGFACPRELAPSSWTEFRTTDASSPRPVDQISVREIGNAMVALCVAGAGLDESELLREALGLLGGKRLTPGISDRLQAALRVAIHQGRLIVDGNGRIRATRPAYGAFRVAFPNSPDEPTSWSVAAVTRNPATRRFCLIPQIVTVASGKLRQARSTDPRLTEQRDAHRPITERYR